MSKRRYVPLPNVPNLSRVEVFDEATKAWKPPGRGRRFRARKRKHVGGKQIERYFELKEKALRWLRQSGETVSNETRPTPVVTTEAEGPTQTLRETWEDLKTRGKGRIASSTLARYSNIVRLYLGLLLDLPLKDLTPKAIDGWLLTMKRPETWTGRSNKRLRFKPELDLIRTLCNHYIEHAEDEQYRNPVRRRHYRDCKVRDRTSVVSKDMTIEHLDLMLAELSKDRLAIALVPMACLQYLHALRISEAAGVNFEDVLLDLANPRESWISICRHVVYRHREHLPDEIKPGFKNSKGQLVLGEKKEYRLFPRCFDMLKTLWSAEKRGPMFHLPDGGIIPYKVIFNAYNAAFRRAKLPFKGTHVLRHGGVRSVLNRTGDLTLAQQHLGNTSMSATQVYAQRAKTAFDEYILGVWDEAVGTEGHLRGKREKK